MNISRTLLVLVALLASPQLFAGVITTFSDRPTFNATVGGALTVEDFTNSTHFPISSGVLNDATNEAGINPGDIESGVTYSTPVGSGNFFNIDGGGGYSTPFLDGLSSSTRDLTVAFDSDVAAFGFDSRQISGETNFDITIQFLSDPDFNGNFAIPNLASGALRFYGFQSSATDIQSVVISFNDGFFGFSLDNFTFGGTPSTDVPEPTALALLGLGLAGMGLLRKRRSA